MAIVADLNDNVATLVQARGQFDFGFILIEGRLPGISQQIQEYRFNQVPIGIEIEFGRNHFGTNRYMLLLGTFGQSESGHIFKKFPKLKSLLLGRRQSCDLSVTVDKLRKTVRSAGNNLDGCLQVLQFFGNRFAIFHFPNYNIDYI